MPVDHPDPAPVLPDEHIAELLLGSIKRLSEEYEGTILKVKAPMKEKMQF